MNSFHENHTKNFLHKKPKDVYEKPGKIKSINL